ncbi:type 1 glutamine amidotransferase [Nitrosovibrio sp. Nv17]|uniref:type 1 glutamine amidotransferase n=1 Tax=Nitrosovibrio sp. Nv17 TaxID=1855339 RepID=UPI0009089408|nr:type 1 glutamine amidotransferase [Nitrosovibrio sp. Nv17]SFW28984.1 GMP synthase-Glutamine amidotransferase [Nitrosovibrio sp. Nv17]
MKPVAIFRHASIEGPGYLSTFLDLHAIPWQLIRIDAGEVPADRATSFSGLVFMGGPMSVNDNLPWIAPVLALIREAVAGDIPVLGHCLGGQLMAKALGARVDRDPSRELGWGRVDVADHPVARAWLGDLSAFEPFHWHGESFTLPSGAVRLFSSPYCPNQAFALGAHLGLQCHVEMTEEMVRTWCRAGADEITAYPGPAVQSAEAMQIDLLQRISALQQVARRLYGRWITGLRRPPR